MLKECIHCSVEFDPHTPAKRAVGGKINECVDCVEELGTEVAIRHQGVTDFSNNDVQVLSFNSRHELDKFKMTKDSENSRLD